MEKIVRITFFCVLALILCSRVPAATVRTSSSQDALKNQIDRLAANIANLQDVIKGLQAKIDAMDIETYDCGAKNISLESKANDIASRISRMETDINGLTFKIQSIENKILNIESRLSRAEQEK